MLLSKVKIMAIIIIYQEKAVQGYLFSFHFKENIIMITYWSVSGFLYIRHFQTETNVAYVVMTT